MIKHHFKIAWRSLSKSKMLSGIHIFGLAIAIAAATLLYLTAMYELSYDKFIKDYDRIGLVYFQTQPEGNVHANATTPAPVGPLLKAELPEIAYLSRYYNGEIFLRHGDKQISSNTKFVDADFLDIFNFNTIQGDNKALTEMDNIVIDDAMAQNLFNSTDVVGKQVEVYANGEWQPKTVSAVIERLPSNSSLNFSSLMRFEQKADYQDRKEDWSHQDHNIFVKVKSSKINDKAFSKSALTFIEQHYKSSQDVLKRNGGLPDKNGNYLSLHLLPMARYHLNNLGLGEAGSPTFPWVLLIISGLILFVACSNFINLSLANSLSRNREIGTRKTLGGTVAQLVKQLWTEAFVLCLIALLLGLGMAWLILPEYNANMNYKLSIAQLIDTRNLIIFVGIFTLLTLFAGGYPAWRIARTNIIQNLKGAAVVKAGRLRNSLTVLQFAIAMVLIVATTVISSQLHYIANRPLGFDKSEVISIPIGSGIDHDQALQQMRNELSSLPWVHSVSAADMNIGRGRDGSTGTSTLGFEHEGKQLHTNFMSIDFDYLETLGIQLVAGRDFDRSFATDTAAVIINKQLAEQLGGVDKVLGGALNLNGKPPIIGIIDDFNFQDLKRKVEPLTLINRQVGFPIEYIFVRLKTNNLSESINKVEQIWKKVNPQARISPSYLDENTDNMYKTEQRFSRIVIGGATVAIVISCLGLFALALLMINRRVKEIGIRKVLGSSVSGIVMLLSKDFVVLLLIAFAIATPLAWLMMNKWLENFAYHVNISWWMFVLGGISTIFLALCTISIQAIKAATANPVESLRDE